MADTSDNFIKLGKLLKKKRDTDIKSRVDRIAESNLSIEEKIKRIISLDKAALEYKKKADAEKAKQKQASAKNISARSKDVLKKIKKPIDDVKDNIKKILPQKFFSFLFTHRSKIKHFGLATHTLKSRFLSFNFDFTKEAESVLSLKIWDHIYALMKPLNYVLREGWKKLTKYEYNLVVYFVNFCEEFYKQDFRTLTPEDLNHLTRTQMIQDLFLISAQSEGYRRHLYSAMERILGDHETYKKTSSDITASAMTILEPNYMTPSLTNIFLAANMINYRKYVTLKELLEHRNIDQINKEHFICTDNIKFRIKNYIEDLRLRLEKLQKEALLIKLLKYTYLKPEEGGEQGFLTLKTVFDYEGEIAEDDKKIYFEDYQRDMIKFMDILISNFFTIFEPLFSDKIKIEEKGENVEVKILPYSVVTNQVFYVRRATERLNRFISSHRSTKVYFEDYVEFLKTGKTPYDVETEFFHLISETSDSFFDLGKTIAYMSEITAHPEPERERKDIASYPYSKVAEHPVFEDFTVIVFLRTLADFCFSFCHFFSNFKQRMLINGDEKITTEIEIIKKMLERLT